MSAGGNRETEIKLRVDSADAARALLRGAGFRISRRRVFESNAVFDTPDRRMRAGGRLLRLRQVGKDAILTYKGVPQAGKHKSREELETHVESVAMAKAIVERLGYETSFVYEKYRTEFQRADGEGVATVDETPVGVFMELEGAPDWIDRIAGELGFSESDYLTASYGSLYLSWCAENGTAPTNMLFSAPNR
jgi:adenylate cyclase class 2